MSALQELQDAIATVRERVAPSVVGLGRGWARGSGIVLAEGSVLTNAHNLRGEDVTVTFADGRQAPGRVTAVDVDGDVAAIAAETRDAPPLEWAPDGETVGIGTAVFAVANPGGGGLRVTFGLVSSTGQSFRGPRGRRIAGSIEHTAALARGSSGSPLVDAQGRLLGLNTVRLDGGLILALAATGELRVRAEALARGDAPPRRSLGLMIAPGRAARRMRRAVGLPERDGLLVAGVADAGPAARAGLERGDLIVRAEGADVARVDDLYEALDTAAESGALELTVVRGIDERTVVVALDATEREE